MSETEKIVRGFAREVRARVATEAKSMTFTLSQGEGLADALEDILALLPSADLSQSERDDGKLGAISHFFRKKAVRLAVPGSIAGVQVISVDFEDGSTVSVEAPDVDQAWQRLSDTAKALSTTEGVSAALVGGLGEDQGASVAESGGTALPKSEGPCKSVEGDLLRRARTELYGLCEAVADDAYSRLQTPRLTEHELGFLRGQRSEAKGIARAMTDVFRELIACAEEDRS